MMGAASTLKKVPEVRNRKIGRILTGLHPVKKKTVQEERDPVGIVAEVRGRDKGRVQEG